TRSVLISNHHHPSIIYISLANMSNMINIRRDVQDSFYRYKMPRLQSKIEGKGNGIKTVIPNMVDIAKALNRPPAYITKFFGAELGALSNCDEKAAKYLVNGAHDAEKLQALLDGFIAKFVLCPNCENPETILSVSKKDSNIFRSCQACGHRSTVDMMHKLVSYIRANPPPKPPRRTQAKDRAGDADAIANNTIGNGGATSSPLTRPSKEEYIDGMEVPEDFDDSLQDVQEGRLADDWAEDEAAAQRQAELAHLSESVKNKLSLKEGPIQSAGDDAEGGDKMDQFGDWLEANLAATNEEIIQKSKDLAIKPDKAIAISVQILLAADLKALKSRIELFNGLIAECKEDKGSKALLGGIERLVGVINPSLLGKTPVILQMIYTEDLVDEEALSSWRDKPSKRYAPKEIAIQVREKAKPFFEWLENASSDEDGEDGSDRESD
ncbi:MAG: eukaryotic translation initiation factor 5, partial [Cyanobacteria bacterium]|nr:eukaryotic translation initiation factor 5 [Cyanobacteriota bacterium]